MEYPTSESFKQYFKFCLPVAIYVIFALIIGVIGWIYTTYYSNWRTGLMTFLSALLWIIFIGFILSCICNLPGFKYGEITVWVIVLILIIAQLCMHTGFTVYAYNASAPVTY